MLSRPGANGKLVLEWRAMKRIGRAFKNFRVISFLGEIAGYGLFVGAYFFLILHFLGDWLKQLFDNHKPLYAALALGLIALQGTLLELVTAAFTYLFRKKPK
jgi:hypothetical protein